MEASPLFKFQGPLTLISRTPKSVQIGQSQNATFCKRRKEFRWIESRPDTFSIILGSIFHRSQKMDSIAGN